MHLVFPLISHPSPIVVLYSKEYVNEVCVGTNLPVQYYFEKKSGSIRYIVLSFYNLLFLVDKSIWLRSFDILQEDLWGSMRWSALIRNQEYLVYLGSSSIYYESEGSYFLTLYPYQENTSKRTVNMPTLLDRICDHYYTCYFLMYDVTF